MSEIKKTDSLKCWQGSYRARSLIAGGNLKWYSHFAKQFDSLLNIEPIPTI